MPNHQVHDIVTMVVSPLAGAGTALVLNPTMDLEGVVLGVAVAVGGLSNLLLTPDLDQSEGWGCYSFHRMRRINPLLGAIWEGYWYTYGVVCMHRGLSHAPILGTLLRVLYATPWLLPLLALGYIYPALPLAWLIGLMWADTWHTILDLSVSSLKRGRL